MDDERLLQLIEDLQEASYSAYGSRRMWKALPHFGERVGRDHVAPDARVRNLRRQAVRQAMAQDERLIRWPAVRRISRGATSVRVLAPVGDDPAASSIGMSSPRIAALARTNESHARKIVHPFDEEGFSSLGPDFRGRRPRRRRPSSAIASSWLASYDTSRARALTGE